MSSIETKQLPSGELIEKKFVKDYTKGMQQALLDVGFWQSCANCHYSRDNIPEIQDKTGPLCTKYNSTPPVSVIVLSCNEWIINKNPPF